jgi:hypothetical protein
LNAHVAIIQFSGPVRWVSGPGATGVTLLGKIIEAGQSLPAQLSLIGVEAAQLSGELADVAVETPAAGQVLLRSGSREFRLQCKTWQLHRDVGATFYAAVPPRPTPWARRLGWRVLLGVAATAPGRWLLSRRKSQI